MPKTSKSDKVYVSINSIYVLIILIIIMAIGILGAIAFPYYISPITYSNGGQPQAGGIMILSLILIVSLLVSAYFLENRNYEISAFFLIIVLVAVMAYVWISYGYTAIKFIFNIT